MVALEIIMLQQIIYLAVIKLPLIHLVKLVSLSFQILKASNQVKTLEVMDYLEMHRIIILTTPKSLEQECLVTLKTKMLQLSGNSL